MWRGHRLVVRHRSEASDQAEQAPFYHFIPLSEQARYLSIVVTEERCEMGTRHQLACASLVALFSILLLVMTNSFMKVQTAKATTVLSTVQKSAILR
jgi:hypothetical protein